MSDLVERVCLHEGFRAKPYQDHLGNWTFGHGLTWISEEESKRIVNERLLQIMRELKTQHPACLDPNFYSDAEIEVLDEVVEVTAEMAFQLGVAGVNKFKKMWAALEAGNYMLAQMEMLDSQWAEQTPERAHELADVIGELNERHG